MRAPLLPSLAVLLAFTGASVMAADAPPQQTTIIVTLDDGTTVPLRNWTLSYEYGMARAGVSPLFAPTARRTTSELYVGKKAFPTAAQTLTIAYTESMRSVESDTGIKTERLKTPRELTLAGTGGKKTTFKLEPPGRDLLMPQAEKGVVVMARTLDVVGETLTGTKKDFCLVSYTPVVECGTTAADRVVKVEFQP